MAWVNQLDDNEMKILLTTIAVIIGFFGFVIKDWVEYWRHKRNRKVQVKTNSKLLNQALKFLEEASLKQQQWTDNHIADFSLKNLYKLNLTVDFNSSVCRELSASEMLSVSEHWNKNETPVIWTSLLSVLNHIDEVKVLVEKQNSLIDRITIQIDNLRGMMPKLQASLSEAISDNMMTMADMQFHEALKRKYLETRSENEELLSGNFQIVEGQRLLYEPLQVVAAGYSISPKARQLFLDIAPSTELCTQIEFGITQESFITKDIKGYIDHLIPMLQNLIKDYNYQNDMTHYERFLEICNNDEK